jgi:hypothetical protein
LERCRFFHTIIMAVETINISDTIMIGLAPKV